MIRRTVLIVLALFICMTTAQRAVARPHTTVSVEVNARAHFSDLDEYGEWYKLPHRGWVWVPDADPGWRPFLYGRWVMTDEGWTWDGEEPYSWIVFHYGSWYYDDDLGWVWVPGYKWSPARVTWVETDDMIAWSPISPSWAPLPGAFSKGWHRYWVSVEPGHMCSPRISEVHVTESSHFRPDAARAARFRAPEARFVARFSAGPIHTVVVKKSMVRRGDQEIVRISPPPLPVPPVPGLVLPIGPQFRHTRPVPAGKFEVVPPPPLPVPPPPGGFVPNEQPQPAPAPTPTKKSGRFVPD